MAAVVQDCLEVDGQPKNRDEEKDMLQKLNVRLACYIERLRELEKENDSIRKDKKNADELKDGDNICEQMARVRKEFECKLYQARCEAEKCAEGNAKLNNEKNCLMLQLNEEEAAQKRAEQDAEKLRLTLRFERDLHRQEMKEMCKQNKLKNQGIQVQISEKYKAQLNEALNHLRSQLEDQLRSNRIQFDNHLKSLTGMVSNTTSTGGIIGSISAGQAAFVGSVTQIAQLQAQLATCQAESAALCKELDYWQRVIASDQNEISNLEKVIKDLCHKYQTLLSDKVKIQAELDAYNNMLKSEERRLKVTDMCDAIAQDVGTRSAGSDCGMAKSNNAGKTESSSSECTGCPRAYDFEIEFLESRK